VRNVSTPRSQRARSQLASGQSFKTFTEENEGNEELLVFLSSKAMLRQGYAWHGKSEPAWKYGPS
jgi:hypothetical protein